jgi:hypothetical protein
MLTAGSCFQPLTAVAHLLDPSCYNQAGYVSGGSNLSEETLIKLASDGMHQIKGHGLYHSLLIEIDIN